VQGHGGKGAQQEEVTSGEQRETSKIRDGKTGRQKLDSREQIDSREQTESREQRESRESAEGSLGDEKEWEGISWRVLFATLSKMSLARVGETNWSKGDAESI
jgi:hypothetical protein